MKGKHSRHKSNHIVIYQAIQNFEVRCLLEGDTYSDLSVNGAVLKRETWHLIKEIWQVSSST